MEALSARVLRRSLQQAIEERRVNAPALKFDGLANQQCLRSHSTAVSASLLAISSGHTRRPRTEGALRRQRHRTAAEKGKGRRTPSPRSWRPSTTASTHENGASISNISPDQTHRCKPSSSGIELTGSGGAGGEPANFSLAFRRVQPPVSVIVLRVISRTTARDEIHRQTPVWQYLRSDSRRAMDFQWLW